jgi:hypothetical protein
LSDEQFGFEVGILYALLADDLYEELHEGSEGLLVEGFLIFQEVGLEELQYFLWLAFFETSDDSHFDFLEVGGEVFEVTVDEPGYAGVASRFEVLRPDVLWDFFFGFTVRELGFELFVDFDLSAQEDVETYVEVTLGQLAG